MQQAEAFLEHVKSVDLPIETLMHDRDKKLTAKVDATFQAADIRVVKSAYRSPNTNAFVERFIQTLQQECLDHFVVFGEQHMDHLVNEFVDFYHEERPHQGKENELLTPGEPQPDILSIDSVNCRERLGGVLKHYHRQAA
ncbi:integrase core domain-containing protein [Blastopirellula retiformator]|uniref:Integrase core domain protein n=1 Tax=Blastopirellula retiformator TaxID=2527970 RepID=A0A5C5UXN2_9BACT|nr:integrase core domain-containing protein [Blastopirellula retiformator]TWT30579.1 Integrase core domain protein [Blastopirellula retiformator]